jgi:peptide/nickel transport system permease protein
MRLNARIRIGLALLLLLAAASVLAPAIVADPFTIATANRLQAPSPDYLLGTDNLGRSILSRTVYGGRISLLVGLTVATISVVFGLSLGLVAGYFRKVDNVIMRFMDGVMAIPGVLLAIAVVTVTGPGVYTVIFAIAIPEIPRVVRLVRAVVLTIREQPFVEAAISSGSTHLKVLVRHVMRHTLAPLAVQATYIAGSAILTEAALSFLGIGTPATTPTWGNMMANGRNYFILAPWIILMPGIGASTAVLTINLLGDGLRDRLDPRLAYRIR